MKFRIPVVYMCEQGFFHICPGGASSGVDVSCLISLYTLQFVKVKMNTVFGGVKRRNRRKVSKTDWQMDRQSFR